MVKFQHGLLGEEGEEEKQSKMPLEKRINRIIFTELSEQHFQDISRNNPFKVYGVN